MKGFHFLLALFILSSCSNNEKSKINVKDPGVFAHYDIRAEEGDGMATCLVRFYTDKSRKTTLTLEDPAKVELDGQPMPLDSSRFMGAYYETQKPVPEFTGQHTISFTSIDNNEFNEKLSFTPMVLRTDLSRPVTKTDLVLEFDGLQNGDLVRVVMIDTAFDSDGINQLETVKDGQVIIEKNQLQALKSGPVVLDISKELEKPLSSGMNGIITITYTLQRNLVLTN